MSLGSRVNKLRDKKGRGSEKGGCLSGEDPRLPRSKTTPPLLEPPLHQLNAIKASKTGRLAQVADIVIWELPVPEDLCKAQRPQNYRMSRASASQLTGSTLSGIWCIQYEIPTSSSFSIVPRQMPEDISPSMHGGNRSHGRMKLPQKTQTLGLLYALPNH